MKRFLLLLLLSSVYAVSLDYSSLYTAPPTIQDRGYLYLTFCSRSNEARTFTFTPQGFVSSPDRLTLDFSGTSTVPDCKQAVVFVSSDSPGMYNLLVEAGSDDWTVPVEFAKLEPISISVSRSVLYTGYDPVDLTVHGTGENVWLTVNSSVVGVKRLYKSSLPATFSLVFHFPEPGFYEVPLTIQYDRNNFTVTQVHTLGMRVEEAPIKVSPELRVPSDGYTNLTISLELPETIYSGEVSLSSPCLEGSTSVSVENFRSGNVSFLVKGSCDPGVYGMNVTAEDFQKTVPLHVYGPEGYELFFNTMERAGEHSVEVIIANEGSQTMKAVSVRLLDGNYKIVREGAFIGDLEFGDYDSAELVFVPRSNPVDVNIKISYTLGGERKEVVRVVPYLYESGSSRWIYLLLVVLAAGVWYVKRRGTRH